MIRRIIAIAGIAVLALAAPAAAQYEEDPIITVTDPTVIAGGPITVNGTCYEPGSTVTLAVDGTALATGTAGADTTVSITATLPADLADGNHTVTLTGPDCLTGSTQVLSASITSGDVTPISVTSTTTGTQLPVTGSDSTAPLVAAGAVLVGGGGLLVLASRKRAAAPTES